MEQSPFIKHFPIAFQIGTFLDVNAKQFNNKLLFLRFSGSAFFFFSTVCCITEGVGNQQDYFFKVHDFLFFIIILANEIFLVINKSQVCQLIEFITEPFKDFEPDTVHSKIMQDYIKEVNFYSKIGLLLYMTPGLMWASGRLFLTLTETPNVEKDGCIRLILGWVSYPGSFYNFILVNVICLFICLGFIASWFLWYLVMFYAIVKIKFKIKLLCADLSDIDQLSVQSEEDLETNSSSVKSVSFEDEQIRAQPTSFENNPRKKENEKLRKNEKRIDYMNQALKQYTNERILKDRVKIYLENIVEQHISIIRYIRLTDKNFQHSLMTYTQLGVIIVALAIPKIGLSGELLTAEYIHREAEILGMLAFMGVYNYFGQILLDELETLRQTLYTCNWMDKPDGLKRGLLIMQTMATKPLQLTIGGMYTLSMETYSNIARAAYSYTSLLQSLSFKEH